jgi:hypothetical protein
VSVRLERLEGVESVRVSLNEGAAYLRLKTENRVRLAQVRDLVEQGGFTPREARVVARGTIVGTGERLRLRLTGTGEMYDLLTDDARVRDRLGGMTGRRAIVEGTVPPRRDDDGKLGDPAIQVQTVSAGA